jgi:hypothetical protein
MRWRVRTGVFFLEQYDDEDACWSDKLDGDASPLVAWKVA